MPTLRLAASFVFDLISPDVNMVFAPGSLMIDVFIRNNYTSDTNAMVVGFLKDFAQAERLVGDSSRAAQLESLSTAVADAVNANLWASTESGGDHYITQLNLDGTTRDFVDYGKQYVVDTF
jgi:methyl coenzyme M reductase alpha subunit